MARLRDAHVRRANRGTVPTHPAKLAQKSYFATQISNKSTTVCKVGGSGGFPQNPFLIWKHIHIHKVHVYEVYAHEVHAHEVHAREMHAREVHAHEVHARLRVFLARRTRVTRISISISKMFKASDCGRLGRQAADHPWSAPNGEKLPKGLPTGQGAAGSQSPHFLHKNNCKSLE